MSGSREQTGPACPEEGDGACAPVNEAARKRAAIETYSRYETALRRTARRYSICADDADDALQRGLEILLTKAPTSDPRELIRWTQTVVKHEALAVRRERERSLSGPAAAPAEEGAEDWVALLPAGGDGPAERVERREAVARSREALQALKPQELRALTLLAEGYSYAEIGQITGYSRTKINRCLAEGRERFRSIVSGSEDGSRCAEMRPLLSAYCDGEAAVAESAVKEHLRACAHCRATLRAYRAAPAATAVLAPLAPFHRSLLERARDAVSDIASRFGGGEAEAGVSQTVATGGGGIAAFAKVTAACLGTVGGAAACVATGVVPAPLGIGAEHDRPAAIERPVKRLADTAAAEQPAVDYQPAPPEEPTAAPAKPVLEGREPHEEPEQAPEPAEPAASSPPVEGGAVEGGAVEGGAVEYAPPPPPAPSASASSSGGNPAGEFGP